MNTLDSQELTQNTPTCTPHGKQLKHFTVTVNKDISEAYGEAGKRQFQSPLSVFIKFYQTSTGSLSHLLVASNVNDLTCSRFASNVKPCTSVSTQYNL